MVVVLVLLLVLVVEHYVPLRLLDVRLEHFVGRVRQFRPLILSVLEAICSDIRVPVGYANVIPLRLQHSWYLFQHLPRVLLRVGATKHWVQQTFVDHAVECLIFKVLHVSGVWELVYLNKNRVTFKFWWIVFVFVFQLHILYYDLREVGACDLMVPLLVHVLGKGRVAYFQMMKLPAPMFRMLLSFRMNWETISRRFYQFWYQSN